jgi:hypothetical protein
MHLRESPTCHWMINTTAAQPKHFSPNLKIVYLSGGLSTPRRGRVSGPIHHSPAAHGANQGSRTPFLKSWESRVRFPSRVPLGHSASRRLVPRRGATPGPSTNQGMPFRPLKSREGRGLSPLPGTTSSTCRSSVPQRRDVVRPLRGSVPQLPGGTRPFPSPGQSLNPGPPPVRGTPTPWPTFYRRSRVVLVLYRLEDALIKRFAGLLRYA